MSWPWRLPAERKADSWITAFKRPWRACQPSQEPSSFRASASDREFDTSQRREPEDTRTQRQQAVFLAAGPLISAPLREWCRQGERSSTDVAGPAQPLRNG